MALITLTEYKVTARVSGTSQDVYLQRMIDYATAYLKRYTKQYLEAQTSVFEYHKPRNVPFIHVRERPLRSVTNLWYDPTAVFGQASGAFASTTLQTAGTDYYIEYDQSTASAAPTVSRSGCIRFLAGQGIGSLYYRAGYLNPELQPAAGTIKVEYNSGFTTIPDDLKLACSMMVRALTGSFPYGGWSLQSESTNHYSYSLGELINKDLQLRSILATYKGLGMSF